MNDPSVRFAHIRRVHWGELLRPRPDVIGAATRVHVQAIETLSDPDVCGSRYSLLLRATSYPGALEVLGGFAPPFRISS